ncbi:hypothetical protein [Luteolibacter sp. LG18]|uniref:IS66 family insertion sequence element accessory protein TnpA n=1 Tax=Luteolibacter sp. LG18 TaxID=2819286 RepID=UPI002B2E7940|nr:hypothetical protein llg_15690 [Luteolibacter sp. LG18]
MTFANFEETSAGVIRADRRGRLLIRAEQRAAILKAFDDSSLSAMAFCRQHGLAYSTFATWIQKCWRLTGTGIDQCSFAEVVVDASMDSSVQAPAAESPRVNFADGTRIEVASRRHLI